MNTILKLIYKKIKILPWIYAIRIKTLTLSISGALMSAILAIKQNYFSIKIFILSLITAISYQILSNIANDLGDGVKGIDNKNSIGPKRTLQSGILTQKELQIGIIIISIFSLISTLYLIYIVFIPKYLFFFLIFLFLGMTAIAASLLYSLSKKPYGYLGLGDLFVFIFFGLIHVSGNYFLYSKKWDWWIMLPASSIGFLCTAVLNLNNMRDIINDTKLNKNTLAVYIGLKYSKIYEIILINLSFCFTLIYILKKYNTHNYKNFLFLVLLFINIPMKKNFLSITNPINFSPYMDKIILLTFIFVILFGLGLLIT